MSVRGFAKQRDKNEPLIVAVFESLGASVAYLSEKGVPDLIVGWTIGPGWSQERNTILVEVKGELGPKGGDSGRRLTPDQAKWWKAWKGVEPLIVRTPEDAVRAMRFRVVTSTGAAGIWQWCPLKCYLNDEDEGSCESRDLHLRGTYPRKLK